MRKRRNATACRRPLVQRVLIEVYETVVLGQRRYRDHSTLDGGTGYRHRGTISKAIASRKLSATRREDGSWAIDCAELARYLDVNGLMGASSDTS